MAENVSGEGNQAGGVLARQLRAQVLKAFRLENPKEVK